MSFDHAFWYVSGALSGFVQDPPDTEFQRGYLSALLAVQREGFLRTDGPYRAAAKLLEPIRGYVAHSGPMLVMNAAGMWIDGKPVEH